MMQQITQNNRKMRRKFESETTSSSSSSSSSSSDSRRKSVRKVPVRVYVRDPSEVNTLKKQLSDMEKVQNMYKERINELESQVCGFKYEKSPETVPLHKMSIQPDLPCPVMSPNSRRRALSSGSSTSNSSGDSEDSGVVIPVQPALCNLTQSQTGTYIRVSSKPHPDRTKLLALYDYVPQQGLVGRLPFKEGDVLLLVSMKSRSGWWTAELNGIVGKIPSNYVEQLDPTRAFKARVIRNFDASQPGDMTIQRGQVITILKRQDNGWYLGQKGNMHGFLPSSCVERVTTPSS